MLRLLTIIFTVFIFSATAQADIYKCVINGKTTFSQKPCALDAEKITVQTYKPSEEEKQATEDITDFYKSEETNREIQSIKKRNGKLRAETDDFEDDMDREIAILQLKKTVAGNNLAGATWEESISQEMSAVTEKYRLKIERVNAKIERNERKIEKLEADL